MKIRSVKIVNGGFKGIEVVYFKEEVKGGRNVINEIKEKRRHPIHLGLEVPFKDLRYHLMDVCGYFDGSDEKSDIDGKISDCEVVEVKFEGGYFVLKGEIGVFGDKKFKLETPKVDEGDGYEYFDTVVKILEKIIEETKIYMGGGANVGDEEVVIRWIGAGKSKEFDLESFNQMSEEERKNICRDILEKEFGAIVAMGDDFEVDNGSEVDAFSPTMDVISLDADVINIPR